MAPSTSLEPNALIADMWEKCQDAIDFKAVRAEGDVLGLWSNDAAVDDMKKALRKFKQLLDAQPPAPESSVGIEAVDLVKTEEDPEPQAEPVDPQDTELDLRLKKQLHLFAIDNAFTRGVKRWTAKVREENRKLMQDTISRLPEAIRRTWSSSRYEETLLYRNKKFMSRERKLTLLGQFEVYNKTFDIVVREYGAKLSAEKKRDEAGIIKPGVKREAHQLYGNDTQPKEENIEQPLAKKVKFDEDSAIFIKDEDDE